MSQKLLKIGQIFVAILLIAAATGLTSCEQYQSPAPSVDPNATWHLSTDIQPIFTTNCVSCHGGNRSPDLRAGLSFQALTAGGFVTLPAATSRLYSTMTGPDHTPRSTADEKLKVLYWITQGAKNN